jgi:hypothetical protein
MKILKLNLRLILLYIFALMTCDMEHAYSQSTYFNIYEPLLSARDASLASAGVANAYDVNIMFSNPAGLTNLRKFFVVATHSQEKDINGRSESIAVPFRIGNNDVMAVGLVVNHTGYAKQNTRPEFRIIQYGYNIGYAKEIIPTLSLGSEIGVRYARSKASSVWAVRSSIGLYYSPSQEISYGIAYNGIGNGIGYSFDGSSTLLFSKTPPHSLQAGLAMHFPSDVKETVFSCNVLNEKVFGTSGILYKGGLEYYIIRFFALRVGYIVDQDRKTATFGFGVRTEPAELDFSIAPAKKTNQSLFISLSIELWKQK